MKKIIVAIDGLKCSKSASQYAVYLAEQTSSQLVGVFLEDFTYHSYKILEVKEGGSLFPARQILEDRDKQSRAAAVKSFTKYCTKARIKYSVRHDRNIAIRELVHESIYADLLIIDRQETLTHYAEKVPTEFIQNLLNEVQCPILLVPAAFKPIDKLILLYDGEPASVYAIRVFSYLLPTLKDLETELLSVREIADSGHLPDNRLMREFMKRHYPKAEYTVLKGRAREEIFIHVKEEEKNILLVLGSNKRGLISRWLKPSMADALMRNVNACLFIA